MIVLWCDAKEHEIKVFEEIKLEGIDILYTDLSLDSKEVRKIKNKHNINAIVFSYVNTKVDKKLLQLFKNLRILITRSTGCDHIDLPYFKSRGIKVCCINGYSTISTAEYTIVLILTLLRNLKNTIMNVGKGFFHRDLGEDLCGKKVGIVGTGRIGSYVAKLLTCFGAEVLCWSFKDKEDLKSIGVRYVSLEELYKNSDIITFHVRLSEKTRYLFNRNSLNMIKKGVLIVNTSRAEVVEIEAIYEGLNAGIIKGCALDCFEEEDFFIRGGSYKNINKVEIIKKLLSDPRVIITPHNAFNSIESRKRDIDYTVDTLIHYIRTGECLYECS